MDKKRWKKISHIIDLALTVPEKKRTTYLKILCDDDPDLEQEILELLVSLDRTKDETEVLLKYLEKNEEMLQDAFSDQTIARQITSLEGQTISRWKLLNLLGRGGMGSVYKAVRKTGNIEQTGALKILHQYLNTPEHIHRFNQEQQILAGLHHPNITGLIDGGISESGLPFLVMEFIEGKPLIEYCDGHRLNLEQRIDLFKKVCRAVQHAHKKLIVHRDLKPENILVTEEGHIKILDFGIAKLLDPDLYPLSSVKTKVGMRIMSLEYAAPEQISGEAVTTATDIYALGIILYELFTGVHPIQDKQKNYKATVQEILHEEIPPPSQKLKQLSGSSNIKKLSKHLSVDSSTYIKKLRGDLDAIVIKSIRKEPVHRYESVEHLVEDIERYQNTIPVLARKGSLSYRGNKFIKRNRGILAATSLFLTLFGSFGLYHLNQITQQRDLAAFEAEKATQISSFLSDLFQASDPDQSLGETLTARELLDKGSERIDELTAQPEVQASLMNVMGHAYHSLGLYNEAEPLVEGAVQRNRELLGSLQNQEKLAKSLELLGRIRIDQRQLEKAENNFQEALDIQRQLYGNEHLDIAGMLNDFTRLYILKGDIDSAEQVAVEALNIMRRLPEVDHKNVATAHTALGRVYQQRQNHESAEEQFTEAIALLRQLQPGSQRELATNINHLGQVRHNQGRYTEAKKLYMEAHQLKNHLLGPDHTETIDIYNNLGVLLYSQELYDEAAGIFRKVLESRHRTVGESHALYGHTLFNLGGVYRHLGKFSEARSAFEKALEVRRSVYGDNHHQVGAILWHLGRFLHNDLAQNNEAELLLNQALDIHQQFLPESHPTLGILFLHYGNVLLDLERPEDALIHLQKASVILSDIFEPDHERIKEASRLITAAQEVLASNK